MKKLMYLLPLLSAKFITSHGQELLKASQPITVEKFAVLKGISGLSLSPDGRLVAFRSGGGLMLLSTENPGEPKRIASGGYDAKWSPAGDAIAFISRDKQTGQMQVFHYKLGADSATRLTTLPRGANPTMGLDWSVTNKLVFTGLVEIATVNAQSDIIKPKPDSSKDGSPLKLTQNSPDGSALKGLIPGVSEVSNDLNRPRNKLFVYDFATEEIKQLNHIETDEEYPRWSPDGTLIVFVSTSKRGLGSSSSINISDADGKKLSVIAQTGETKKFHPSWSPTGPEIAYYFHSYTDAANHGIAVAYLDKKQAVIKSTTITSKTATQFIWASTGRSIFTRFEDDVVRPVTKIDILTKKTQVIGNPETIASGFTAAKNGAFAWIENRPHSPASIHFLKSTKYKPKEIFDPNPELKNWNLGQQEVVRWKNKAGHQRSGVLIKPAGHKPGQKYPLIVSAYAQGSHPNGFASTPLPGYGNQEFASKGYAVFFPGPRLPWMYGTSAGSPEEAKAIAGDKGWDITVDDVESGVDLLIKRGIVDKDRMAIMGHSNGGAATAAVITKTSRYKAAVLVAPANLNWFLDNMFRDDMSGNFPASKTFTGIGKDIIENPMAYFRGSPAFRAEFIKTPTLLAIGDDDHYTFVLPTVQIFLAMRAKRREVTLLRYPGQGHVIFGPSGDDLYKRIMEFIDLRLKPSKTN